jgi:hypothetical protein
VVLAALATISCCLPPQALAFRRLAISTVALASLGALRPLVTGATAFQSDGAEYAAWQVAASPAITVLDVRDGHEHLVTPPAGCKLMGQGILGEIRTGAARFMLECGSGQQAVLDARSGVAVDLSRGAGASYEWISSGRLYAESRRTCGNGQCIALEDLRTGAVSLRRHFALYDLNRPGAPVPVVCGALRRRLASALEIAEPGYFAFADGVFALSAKSDEGVELLRCKGNPRILQQRMIPRDFQLGSGILTWDTGYALRESAPEEALSGPVRLISYRLVDGSRHEWRLPSIAVSGIGDGPQPFGYSAHAGNTVFWIAATSAFGGEAGATLDQATIYSN